EDVVQEVFIKIWESHKNIYLTESIRGFLFIITRNIIFNKKRDSLNETFLNYTIINGLSIYNNLEEEIDAKLLSEYIMKLIDRLTPRQKEIFLLSRTEHLTYKQIAQQLNITEKTVEHHINNALRYLRSHLPVLILVLFINLLFRK
ncbi:MAG: sigma-70 family RNA polymerase sigma factor, partial [Tannerellaceae bacterium]|nr:sigma-70 family RNA polymerase sigma factor [Tannerellaceae bacterium]